LTIFLVAAVIMQWRQSSAIATSGRITELKERRTALESERAELERQVRLATSRKVLGARAEALGLHFPEDSEFFYLDLGPGKR
jgi:hypothetical protein